MKEDNLSGICIEPDLRNLYLRLNNERLPIIENGRIELFPITEHEQETGGAADVKEIQFPTNSVRSQNAPTIAGVKRGKPMTFVDAADILVEKKYKDNDRKTKNKHSLGSSTNPNFKKGEGYQRNCQVCVAVFEARMRGYDIEALPLDENNEIMMELRANPEKAFIDKKTNLPPKLIYDEKITDYKKMCEWLNTIIKPSEHYGFICKIVLTQNGQDLYDHILIAYKTEQGELRFYDPQNGVDSEYFWNIRFNHGDESVFYPTIFRIDNADLNIDYLNKVSKKHRH
ncbi:MAG: toxin glutamine deamidase domain-containing protein, partial [Candidatus Gastranaerophilaceae bacterium]|nr:toxin glutamine deamidase domain-containing protein [Candidatus Gastranaerophilaceae bacterium]